MKAKKKKTNGDQFPRNQMLKDEVIKNNNLKEPKKMNSTRFNI